MDKLNDDYLLVIPEIEGISIFDSLYYDTFDLEVLGPAQRRHLIQRATSVGFKQKTGRVLTHPDSTEIHFPTSRLFNRNFRSTLPKSRKSGHWLALTPTQSAFLLFERENFDEQDLFQLMMKHPFNVNVLSRVTSHEAFYPAFLSLEVELRRLFQRAQVMLKNKKPLS